MYGGVEKVLRLDQLRDGTRHAMGLAVVYYTAADNNNNNNNNNRSSRGNSSSRGEGGGAGAHSSAAANSSATMWLNGSTESGPVLWGAAVSAARTYDTSIRTADSHHHGPRFSVHCAPATCHELRERAKPARRLIAEATGDVNEKLIYEKPPT